MTWNYFDEMLVGTEPGLKLYWRFDEGSADRATDSAFTTAAGGPSDGALVGSFAYVPGVFADPLGSTNRVNEDTTTPIFLPGYDVEGWTSLTYQIIAAPTQGTLDRSSGNWNPAAQNPVNYTPTSNYDGPDFFTYQLTDPQGAVSPIATMFLQVASVNDLPNLSAVDPLVIEEDSSSPDIPITATDAETPADALQLFGSSGDPSLIKSSGITFGGSGNNRTVTITPVSGQLGQTTVQIEVLDGDQGSRRISFSVKVWHSTALCHPGLQQRSQPSRLGRFLENHSN